MQLVDTNILAYLLIEGDRNAQAAAILKYDPDWHSEHFVLVEFTNVLLTCLRAQALTMSQANDTLDKAKAVFKTNLRTMDHSSVLRIAHEYGVSAYDARYLAMALELDVPLITEDKRLRRTAPKLTQSMDEVLKRF